jgi:hypothetical protein
VKQIILAKDPKHGLFKAIERPQECPDDLRTGLANTKCNLALIYLRFNQKCSLTKSVEACHPNRDGILI